ncbi:Tht1-like nuclear fusion protein-domain-containing protein [Kalaharituber pfeilii]|nr:Tht1-like nuclear fusion protein-domain-containing protein [Kalaharituber pfeilii]
MAHAKALELFESLSSKSSCHGEAASALMRDCAVLSSRKVDDDLRTKYAVELALCEFKSTGISYPQECKDLGNYRSPKLKCIRKLEEKPQHWTTLSNNLQNVISLCVAARHELEKDELLSLHRNITKVQQSLFGALESHVNEAWMALQSTKTLHKEWKDSYENLLNGLKDIEERTVQALEESNDRAVDVISELIVDLKGSLGASQELSNNLREAMKSLVVTIRGALQEVSNALRQINGSTQEFIDNHEKSLQETAGLAQKIHLSLIGAHEFTTKNLFGTLSNFSNILTNTNEHLNQVESEAASISGSLAQISSSYERLESTQSKYVSSLAVQQRLHGHMVSSIERATENVNTSMDALLARMEKLNYTVVTVEKKIQGIWQWRWLRRPTYIMGFERLFRALDIGDSSNSSQ